jgi:hypothetical protein
MHLSLYPLYYEKESIPLPVTYVDRYFIIRFGGGGETKSTWYAGHYLAYYIRPRGEINVEQLVELELIRESEVLRDRTWVTVVVRTQLIA